MEERRNRQKYRDKANESKLKGLYRELNYTGRIFILYTKITGAWMDIRGTTVIVTVLLATEFCDFLFARYNVTPPNLQSNWNGCGTSFNVNHTLRFWKGGLVIAPHNKMRDEILYLARRSINSAALHTKTLIHKGRNRSERGIRQGSENWRHRVN